MEAAPNVHKDVRKWLRTISKNAGITQLSLAPLHKLVKKAKCKGPPTRLAAVVNDATGDGP